MYMPVCVHAHTPVHVLPMFSRAAVSSPGQQLEEVLGVLRSLCTGGGILPAHLHLVFPFSLVRVHVWA